MSGLILIGAVLVAFAMPIGFYGFLGNHLSSKIIAIPLFLLGVLCILSDIFQWYEWVQIVIGVPPEKRWRKKDPSSASSRQGE